MTYSGDEIYPDDVTSGPSEDDLADFGGRPYTVADQVAARLDPTETLRHRCIRTDAHTIGECVDYQPGAEAVFADISRLREAVATLESIDPAGEIGESISRDVARLRETLRRIDDGEL